jgi:lipooligosaccharide transport system ATP-binding protein
MNTAIAIKNLTKTFGNLTAVNCISFEIREGECFGFLGPNGAGKTTTVRTIHCVSPVTSGSVSVFGETAHLDNRNIKRVTGVIPQEITLDDGLTVQENLMIFARFFDIPKAEAKRRVDEHLAFVDLEAKKNSRIEALSTGMKRRLLIARALLNNPRLIIADEPTTGLDPQARHIIWQRLRLLKSRGVTILLTTQYMEEAAQLCDRLVIMDKGRILKQGAPRQLVQEEIGAEVIEIRVGPGEEESLPCVLAEEACGHEKVGDTHYFYCREGHRLMQKVVAMNLANVLHRPATLEDVFLKLTGRSLVE